MKKSAKKDNKLWKVNNGSPFPRELKKDKENA